MFLRTRTIALALLLLTSMLCTAGWIQSAKAETITVPDDYLTIQEAIDAAYDGDTIFVRNGTYFENIDVNKTLVIIGENRGNTTIVGNGRAVVTVSADDVTIAGFTIQNGTYAGLEIGWDCSRPLVYGNNITYNDGAGIEIYPSGYYGNITENIITNNGGTGIGMNVVERMVVSRNIIENNTVGISLGIGDDWAGRNTITENLIVGHEYGIRLNGARGNLIHGNNITGNNVGLDAHAISTPDGAYSNNTISENDISANNYGFYLLFALNWCDYNKIWGNNITSNNICGVYAEQGWDDFPVPHNAFYHNNLVGNTLQVNANSANWTTWDNGYPSGGNYWGDYIGSDIYSGVHQNEIGSDGIGDVPYVIDANNTDVYPLFFPYGYAAREPRTWVVDDDGSADFHTIQEAINVAIHGDTIFVRNGTYYENVVVNKSVSLTGENKDATIIDGNFTYDGVAVRANNVSVSEFTIQRSRQNGITIDGTVCNTISNNIIIDNNSTEGWYGGIWLSDSSNNSLSGNKIAGNSEYGIWTVASSYNNISGNNVSNNFYGIIVQGITLSDSVSNSVSENDVAHNEIGIMFESSPNGSISGNSVTANGIHGIMIGYSDYCRISGNNITANVDFGIFFRASSNSNVSENSITANHVGIFLISIWDYCSDGNSIVGNNITNNDYGIMMTNDSSTLPSNNGIYHNNFINNGLQTTPGGVNVWDDGYPSGGNYWGDYIGVDLYHGFYQNETGSDGIGDTPYIIDENNADRYPLMRSWSPLVGDINNDGVVGLSDLVLLAKAYGSEPEDLNWNPYADFDHNLVIGLTDLVILANHYGQHYP